MDSFGKIIKEAYLINNLLCYCQLNKEQIKEINSELRGKFSEY